MKPKVLVITGPTGSGKTKLSVELAKKLNGEIISADSMQIYKQMDIGTAKPTPEELNVIPHHMIDIVDVGDNFSVADYKKMAFYHINNIVQKSKLPIVVGGTGLYINSIVEEINYFNTGESKEFREELNRRALKQGNEILYNELIEKDPEAASRIHINDLKRIIRALEVYEFSKITITEQQKNSKEIEKKYDYTIIGLTTERCILYDRINKRVDEMFENGLLEEAHAIILKSDLLGTSYQAIGYKELKKYFDGSCTLEEAKETIKRETRRYAKRQLTWFRRNENIHWLDIKDGIDYNIEKVLEIIYG